MGETKKGGKWESEKEGKKRVKRSKKMDCMLLGKDEKAPNLGAARARDKILFF
jgi:hypothetical protein